MTSLSTTPAAQLPGFSLKSWDLVRILVGSPSVEVGHYPAELARKGATARAEHLRDLNLHFTTAQELISGAAAKERGVRRRIATLVLCGSLLALGLSAGVAIGWWRATSAQRLEAMPQVDWRIQAIVPGAAVVRVGNRLWPIRAGDKLPSGERVIVVDERSQSVATESGVFKLAPQQERTPSTPAAAPAPHNP